MGKQTTVPKQPPNTQLFARLSHLYQASYVLTTRDPPSTHPDISTSSLSRFYLNHLRSVAKKSVVRLDSSIKRTICRRCDSLLVLGVSCKHRMENKSKNGKKPWADVLVVECKTCGTMKRFPVGMDGRKAKEGMDRGDGDKQPDRGAVKVKNSGKKGGGKKPLVFRMASTTNGEKSVEVRDATSAANSLPEYLSDTLDMDMNDKLALEPEHGPLANPSIIGELLPLQSLLK